MEKMITAYKILVEDLKLETTWGDLGIDWSIIFKWILEVGYESVDWMHLAQDRNQSCEHKNKPSGPVSCGEFGW
jgi:hypothetical protein